MRRARTPQAGAARSPGRPGPPRCHRPPGPGWTCSSSPPQGRAGRSLANRASYVREVAARCAGHPGGAMIASGCRPGHCSLQQLGAGLVTQAIARAHVDGSTYLCCLGWKKIVCTSDKLRVWFLVAQGGPCSTSRPRQSAPDDRPGAPAPDFRPVVVAANHPPNPTFARALLVLPRQPRFVAKAEYFAGHGLRGASSAGCARRRADPRRPRRRGRGRMPLLRAVMGVLRDGGVWAIYPRAPARPTGVLPTGTPASCGSRAWSPDAVVVPVGLVGTEQIRPPRTGPAPVAPPDGCGSSSGQPVDVREGGAEATDNHGGDRRADRPATAGALPPPLRAA